MNRIKREHIRSIIKISIFTLLLVISFYFLLYKVFNFGFFYNGVKKPFFAEKIEFLGTVTNTDVVKDLYSPDSYEYITECAEITGYYTINIDDHIHRYARVCYVSKEKADKYCLSKGDSVFECQYHLSEDKLLYKTKSGKFTEKAYYRPY